MDIQEKIKTFFNRFKKSNFKIAVFGDSIVDEYFYVDSTRISPEFPIPVNLTGNDKPNLMLPGGAGNVCRQFFNFNNIELVIFLYWTTNLRNAMKKIISKQIIV